MTHAPGIIEVRIRTEDDEEGRTLTHWPLSDIDGLLDTLRAWGVWSNDVPAVALHATVRLDPVPHLEVVTEWSQT